MKFDRSNFWRKLALVFFMALMFPGVFCFLVWLLTGEFLVKWGNDQFRLLAAFVMGAGGYCVVLEDLR